MQVFSCEICEIFKNALYTEQLQWLLLYGRQMREKRESNRFWQLAPLFTQQFTPRDSRKVEVML